MQDLPLGDLRTMVLREAKQVASVTLSLLEPPAHPPLDIEAFLDELDDEAAAEEIDRVYRLTPEAREAELRAKGLDPERAHTIAREAIALFELLHAEGAWSVYRRSAEELHAAITKAGLDPQKVGDRVQTALAEWRS